MSRTDRVALGALFLLLAGSACTQQSGIELDIPRAIRDRVEQLQVRVYEPGIACSVFADWRRTGCKQSCDEYGEWGGPGVAPISDQSFDADAGGSFPALEIELPSGDGWDVFIVGRDADGETLVAGCESVDAGDERTRVPLRSLWCEQRACDGVHPDCVPLDVICPALEDPPEELAQCRTELFQVGLWRDPERECPADGRIQLENGICRKEIILCDQEQTSLIDGVCPREEPLCYEPGEEALDVDCDNKIEFCGTCLPGEELSCTQAACTGIAMCVDGMYGGCLLGADVEVCDGVDNNCDRRIDEEPEASQSCFGVVDGVRFHDTCLAGECACGTERCRPSEICCDGLCASGSSNTNCGSCGVECGAGTACQDGECQPNAVDGGPTPIDAGVTPLCTRDNECFGYRQDFPTLDTCTPDGCRCGADGDECLISEGRICCDGGCRLARTDPLHCGGCFRPCARDEQCVMGSCLGRD